jgi:hypothetical protein
LRDFGEKMGAHGAQHQRANYLVLNVAPDNVQKLGYIMVPPLELSRILNVERLAENAGTKSHPLLNKTIA